jgi:hypothetical protein
MCGFWLQEFKNVCGFHLAKVSGFFCILSKVCGFWSRRPEWSIFCFSFFFFFSESEKLKNKLKFFFLWTAGHFLSRAFYLVYKWQATVLGKWICSNAAWQSGTSSIERNVNNAFYLTEPKNKYYLERLK